MELFYFIVLHMHVIRVQTGASWRRCGNQSTDVPLSIVFSYLKDKILK